MHAALRQPEDLRSIGLLSIDLLSVDLCSIDPRPITIRDEEADSGQARLTRAQELLFTDLFRRLVTHRPQHPLSHRDDDARIENNGFFDWRQQGGMEPSRVIGHHGSTASAIATDIAVPLRL